MPGQLSWNELPGVFVVSSGCCGSGLIKKGSFPWVGIFLKSVRKMSSSLWSSPWMQWFSCGPSPWITTETDFPPVVGGQALTRVPSGKCLSGAAGSGHSNLLTLFSGAALDSCVCPVPENVFLAFRFRFWSQNTIFFLCESGNTCGFLSKTCACGIQCFSCLWCFLIIGGFNIKKLKKMAAV